MHTFDQIVEIARKNDLAVMERNINNQNEIFALHEHLTYGKSKFFQTKDDLNRLSDKLKNTFESPEFGMFREIADVQAEQELDEGPAKLLFLLRNELGALCENSRKYTEIRDGFTKGQLNETLKREQGFFIDTLTGIQTVEGLFDKLMMYDISDSKEFDSLYVAFNDVRKRYSDVAEGSLNVIQDSYYKGQKVYKITGKEPHTDVALQKRKENEEENKRKNQPFRENLTAVWEKEFEPLFSHDPCPEDVMQGCVGDCYLVAALASIAAQNPDRIREMIKLKHIEEKDPEDPSKTIPATVAVVRLYTDKNEPVDITVPYTSCYLKGTADGQEFSEPLYAGGAAWVKMIEKALAVSGLHSVDTNRNAFDDAVAGKYDPDLDVIRGGRSHQTMQTLLGPEMSELFMGTANLRNKEIQLFSETQYKDYDKAREKLGKTQCGNARAIIQKNNEDIQRSKNSVKKFIDTRYTCSIDLTKEGAFDALFDELTTDPSKADQYFTLKEGEKEYPPKRVFEKAREKTEHPKAVIADAQAVLDKWDPAKCKKPWKFPPEYVKEEEQLYNDLEARYLSGMPLAAARPEDPGQSDNEYDKYAGLPFNHAYSITNVFTSPDGTKYVEVRNPHNRGGRAYDAEGNAVYDPDPSRMGYSQIELRDFSRSFVRVYVGQYEPRMTFDENASDRKDTLTLYGEALMSICRVIDKSDTYKKSPEYNNLRAQSKILMRDLQNRDIKYTDLEKSITDFFNSASDYKVHRDAERRARTRNKVSAANRYVSADAALKIRDLMSANARMEQRKDRQKADLTSIIEQCKTIHDGDSIAKRSSVELFAAIDKQTEAKRKAKENAARSKAKAQGEKISEKAKQLLAKGIRNLNEQDIVTAISTMVYVDEVRSGENDLSSGVLAEKYSRDGLKRGIDNLKKPVTDALKEILTENRNADPVHGQENFLNSLSRNDGAAVKMVKEQWKAQIGRLHPDALEEAKDNQVVKYSL